ncbi:two-component system response regulator DctR [Oxalobacteraceae bacterium GrIS 2.11]
MTTTSKTIAIVDDDEGVRESLKWLLSTQYDTIKCFSNGIEFLADYHPEKYNCIILDVRMPEMNGLEIFYKLRAFKYFPPVIFLSGHAELCTAVEAVKNGASEFLQKPVVNNELVEQIKLLIHQDAEKREKWQLEQKIKDQLAHLTSREYEVMQLMLTGKLNKQVAYELGIAIKTVEVHRSRILEKMNVRSALALSHLLNRIEDPTSRSASVN